MVGVLRTMKWYTLLKNDDVMIIMVQDVLEKKITLEDAKNMVIMHQGEPYTYFDEGCSRFVYSNKASTKVIKMLKSSVRNYNEEEAFIYENATDEDKAQMAKTTLTYGLIEQEFCVPIKFGGRKLSPSQRLFATSCRNEVGWDKNNELVCFDLDEFKKY